MATANSILVEPANGFRVVRERLAGGAITPGHVLTVNASNAYIVNAALEGNVQKIVALENVAAGEGIADAYVSGETVRGLYVQPGDLVNCLVANGAPAIAQGDALVVAADGTVVKKIPITALTDSSGGSANDVIAAITNAANTGSADVGPTADAVADLAAKVNALIADNLGAVFGVAAEAVDNSGGSVPVRILVEVA